MKINNNTLYKIFFYLLITIFIIWVITFHYIEYFDTNKCNIPLKKEEKYDTKKKNTKTKEKKNMSNKKDIPEKCMNLKYNPCNIKVDSSSQKESINKSNADIIVYNDRIYNNKENLEKQGKKMVNYITLRTIDDLKRFKLNYPKAFSAFIESNRDIPTWYKNKYNHHAPPVSSFVYIPK